MTPDSPALMDRIIWRKEEGREGVRREGAREMLAKKEKRWCR